MSLHSNGYEDLSLVTGQEWRIQETQIQILKMKPFGSSSLQNPLKLRAKISKSTILYENYNNCSTLKNTTLTSIYSFHRLCCGGLFGDISRDRRWTRRSTFWSAHRLQCLAFSILAFWIIGWYSTASRNWWATRQLLLSSPFDPLPSRLRVLEQRAE